MHYHISFPNGWYIYEVKKKKKKISTTEKKINKYTQEPSPQNNNNKKTHTHMNQWKMNEYINVLVKIADHTFNAV